MNYKHGYGLTKCRQNVDPMFVYGAATLGCAGMLSAFVMHYQGHVCSHRPKGFGYLVGPVIGSSIWRLTHRRLMRLIEKRDKEFHQHIVKNRVDPTAQSATNPVPDYYGALYTSLLCSRLPAHALPPQERKLVHYTITDRYALYVVVVWRPIDIISSSG